jgi:phenylacetate-coenzyme A ligase PaaK-like adenylate-forming protein
VLRSLGWYRKTNVDYRVSDAELLDRLAVLRPDVLSASPALLARTGRAKARIRPGTIAPRLVISGGEVLTPHERRQISEMRGARIVDMYSSHDLGFERAAFPTGLSSDDQGLHWLCACRHSSAPGTSGLNGRRL